MDNKKQYIIDTNVLLEAPNALLKLRNGNENLEIGQKLGYLPGRIEEKMEPYTLCISDLLVKLHRLRAANKLFVNN